MPLEQIHITVPGEHHLERIDKFITLSLEIDLSRSYIQKLIKNQNILVNQKAIKQNYKVKTDDSILIEIPEPEILTLSPEDIPVPILYEDDSIAIINKPPGMVVHPGPGNRSSTLVNALLFHLKDLSSIGGVERPGIVHRLDKDTSGLMVITKNDSTHRFLANKFASRDIIKRYTAIVIGKPPHKKALIDKPIGRHPKYRHKMTITEKGREAKTDYSIEKVWNSRIGAFSLLNLTLHTGRTHQIRVHMSSEGNPIVGDPIYSKKWAKYRVPYLLLASTYLEFEHPGREIMKFIIQMPEHMENFIKRLESNS